MNPISRLFVLFAIIAALTPARSADTIRKYYIQRNVSGTVNRITIGDGTRTIQLLGGYLECSVACSPYIGKNGTVSGGSSGAAILQQLDERGPSATFSIVLDGTVSSQIAVLDPPGNIAAGGNLPIGGGLTIKHGNNTSRMTAELASSDSGNLYIYLEVAEL